MAKMKDPKTFEEMKIKLKDLRLKVRALQRSMNNLKATGIRESELTHMILRSANRYYKGVMKYRKPITQTMVKAILDGVDNLEEFVYPPQKPIQDSAKKKTSETPKLSQKGHWPE